MRTGTERAWRRGLRFIRLPRIRPFFVLFASVNTVKRGSQLLHKYDEQAAHPESFQRISNLSGKLIQVKWQAYWSGNVLWRKILC
ncbi:hypothetical protein CRI65_15225 [Escherichia sp. E3659]|nr:hypothetical protein CRT22_10270 [Escherichia sp. E5028]TGB84518.1 hypothetical protein CRI65_15225 [Escherichia sp. E3659]TGC03103.1 hypothetical protein CRI63_12950 [Escherichia sp. E2661]